MLEEVAALGVSYFSECMLDLATNAGIAKYRESANRKKLKESLRSYCKQQKKYNEISSIDEEFDFSAVDEYIINELTDDAKKCLFNADRDTRAEARKHIITKITNLSNAKTDEAKRRIRKQVSNSLEIIKQFYFHKVNKEYWFLAAQIVDPIVDELQQLSEDVQNNLSAEIHNAHAEAQNHSLEKMLTEARQGNLKPFQNQIDLYLGALNSTHPLKPYYGYTLRDGIPFSTPLTDEAQSKFPPRFICKGFITVGDTPVQGIDLSVIDYADRHQLPITVNLEEVKKLLGNIPDPNQHEAEYLKGKTITRYPKPFPPAMPHQLLFNGKIIINYFELRVKEILDNQTLVVTNEEQTGCNIKIRIEINFKTNRNNFSIRLTNPTNQEILIFLRLLSAASKGGDLTILSLKNNRQLLYGRINHFKYQSEFDSIEEECDFVTRQ